MTFVVLGLQCILATPCVAQPTWTLTENLRLGTAVDGPDTFANVNAVAVTKNGNMFVVDVKPLQIKLFSPTGKFLRNVGRTGGGPGEYTDIGAMLINTEGNVQVMAPNSSRVLVFSPDGALVREATSEFPIVSARWEGTLTADGGWLDPISIKKRAQNSTTTESRRALQRVRPDGARRDTLLFPGCALQHAPDQAYLRFNNADGSIWQIRVPYLADPQTVFANDGTAWCAPGDMYAVYHFRVGRPDTMHVARLNVSAPPIPDSLRTGLQKTFDRAANGKTAQMPKFQPTIRAIRMDDMNRLWVRRTVTPDDTPTFDVFDAQGRPLALVKTTVRWIGIPLVVGDVAYGLVMRDDDVPLVVRAPIRR